MRNSQSQIFQVRWKITDEFFPRRIVIDGRIRWVSTICHSRFIVSTQWLPSRIQLIPSKNLNQNKFIISVVIGSVYQLEEIESEAFQKVDLKFIAIPNSIAFLNKCTISARFPLRCAECWNLRCSLVSISQSSALRCSTQKSECQVLKYFAIILRRAFYSLLIPG
jgi:hypothetical protein